MVERRLAKVASLPKRGAGGHYFTDAAPVFISSGCAVLDCALGGGWPLGRIANIVGDKSTGKTLLAIEACANFAKQFPKGKIYYREAEAAFDEHYAAQLGLPTKRIDFGPKGLKTKWSTIEDVFRDLRKIIEAYEESPVPGLYIIDSLDALTSEATRKREVGGGYNLEKQKVLSQLFAEMASEFKAASLCVIFVSQVRDKIGFVIGEKHTRSGGHSLDFYSSQIVWLNHLKTLTQTIGGAKRATGIRVVAKLKKNKLTRPFGKCDFVIRFGFGIDDLKTSVDWLVENKMLDRVGLKASGVEAYLKESDELSDEEFNARMQELRAAVLKGWQEVDERFTPPRRKYG